MGAVDFGHTGEAPPVFAQAAGAPLLYVGNEPSSPTSEAILVPAESAIKSVTDLKGKRVALNKGSNVHYLLVRALEQAGLQYSDISPGPHLERIRSALKLPPISRKSRMRFSSLV